MCVFGGGGGGGCKVMSVMGVQSGGCQCVGELGGGGDFSGCGKWRVSEGV